MLRLAHPDLCESPRTHQVRVYRVTEEYAALEAFRIQNLDELSEPPTNIENGLGIFTAFSSAVVEFEVVRPTD